MIYKILCGADFHWGAMDPDKQKEELRFIYEYLEKNPIDLLVICGDYFDHRLLLNSKSCIYALEMLDELKRISDSTNHFKIRIFTGTKSHDNDQLDALRPLEDPEGIFKIFTETNYEETLEDLHCLYCPDETMYTDDYLTKYNSLFFTNHTQKNKPTDIMFFHGSFDVILGDILRDNDNPNVVFEYNFFNTVASVMIGGHWHDASSYGNVIYTRSPNRYKFDEDKPKGIVLLNYDTDTQKYTYERIENKYTDEYKTYIIDTSLFRDINDYTAICDDIDDIIKNDPNVHVRIQIFITDEKEINKSCIDSVRFRFSNSRNVKVTTENKLSKKKKEQKRQYNAELKSKYSYLYDKSISLDEKFKIYIKETTGVEVDSEQLRSLLAKYI